jgi:stearoyl-CoA desaturase (delta-9 desaturase)
MMNQNLSLLVQLLLGVVVGVAVSMIANVVTTVFLHRGLSHRALTMATPLRAVFRVLTWITTGIRPRQWAAVHRKHHAFTDVEGDPHSPVLLGWRRVQMTNVALYRTVAQDDANTARYAKDLPADRWDRALFDRALVGLAIGIALLVLTFGWVTGLVAAFVHANVYLATSSAVNAIGHQFGRRPYDNRATNNQWLAWLTAGEGLHNNHHAAPTSARLSHRRWEFDPGWWVITALRRVGLVKVRLSEVVVAKTTKRPARNAA